MRIFDRHDPGKTATDQHLNFIRQRFHLIIQSCNRIHFQLESSRHRFAFSQIIILILVVERYILKLTFTKYPQNCRAVGGGKRLSHHLSASVNVNVFRSNCVIIAVVIFVLRTDDAGFSVGVPGRIAVLRQVKFMPANIDLQMAVGRRTVGNNDSTILVAHKKLRVGINSALDGSGRLLPFAVRICVVDAFHG